MARSDGEARASFVGVNRFTDYVIISKTYGFVGYIVNARFGLALAVVWLLSWCFVPICASVGESSSSPDRFSGLIGSARNAIGADPAKAIAIADRAGIVSARLPQAMRREALAEVAWLKASAFVAANRPQDAISVTSTAAGFGESQSLRPKLAGDIQMVMANAQSMLGQTEAALYGLQRAYRFYQAAGDMRGRSLALQNIGTIFFYARNFDQALRYYDQASATYSSDKVVQTTLLNNRGNALKEKGKLHAAEDVLGRAALLAQATHNAAFQIQILSNLATVQVLTDDIGSAEHTISQAFELSVRSPKGADAFLYGVAAEVALRRHNLEHAKQLIELSLARVGPDASKMLNRYVERIAYQIYKARGQPVLALVHLERYNTLDDQVRAVAASTNAALMSAQFDFANQNARIAQLRRNEAEQEATIQRNRVRFQRWLLGGAGLLVAVLLIGVISIRRSRDQVRAANDELSGTNAELEQALAVRTEFLATTSHEIRTPLNGILGMTQVLLADRALDREVRGKIELVQGAGETMKALVDDILDVAKIANGELTVHRAEMDLHRLLRDAAQVWEAQASTKQVAIALDMADVPHRIIEDEVRLRQIVFNLMANAVKFTDRGIVRLHAAVVDEGGADRPNDGIAEGYRLRIAISDTGIGIPADRLEDIFESFRQVDGGTTRRHGGTGLGLAICRNLARIMGGDVRVASVLGGGSTFTVDLPCEPVAVPAARAAAATLAETRLLLLDGNPLARSVLTALLAPHVARIVPAGDSDAAQALIDGEGIDFVLADAAVFALDIGRVAAFAAAHAGLRIVLLWPTPDESVRIAAGAAGILRIVAKPIAAPDLVAALKDIYMVDNSPEEIAA